MWRITGPHRVSDGWVWNVCCDGCTIHIYGPQTTNRRLPRLFRRRLLARTKAAECWDFRRETRERTRGTF